MPYSTSYEFLKLVVSRYLFNRDEPLTPQELVSPDVIDLRDMERDPISVTLDDFMAGPGRFALPSRFEIVERFFEGNDSLLPGTYTKQEVAAAYGMDSYGFNFRQYQYADPAGEDDWLIRTFVWNSTSMKLGDDVRFVVEWDGSRHIQNLSIGPYYGGDCVDNFDFESNSWLAQAFNYAFGSVMDPSRIGNTVDLAIQCGTRLYSGDYTYQDYLYDAYVKGPLQFISGFGGLALPTEWRKLINLLKTLWEDGVTRFQDSSGRLVLYGTHDSDELDQSTFKNTFADYVTLPIALNIFSAGAHFVAGQGDDTLEGLSSDDALQGNEGDDSLYGNKGDDVLLGGIGNDRLHGGQDNDILYDDDGEDLLAGDDGNDLIVAAGGDDRIFGGAGQDVIIADIDHDFMSLTSSDGTAATGASVSGDNGDDVIVGGAYAILHGGSGDDTLFGALGSRMEGGSGADVFVMADTFQVITDASDKDRLFIDLDAIFGLQSPAAGQHVLFPILGGFLFRVGWEDSRQSLSDEDVDFPGGYMHVHNLEVGGEVYDFDVRYVMNGADLYIDIIQPMSHDDLYDGFSGAFWPWREVPPMVIATVVVEDYDEGTDLGLKFYDCIYPSAWDGVIEWREEGERTIDRYYPELSNNNSAVMGPEMPDFFALTETLDLDPGADPLGREDPPERGGDGGDAMNGDDGNDDFAGGDGNDTLRGEEGNDRLQGEEGDDTLDGGRGSDVLDGGPGNDVLDGSYGDDTLIGGEGNDRLLGGDQRDLLDGGVGDDHIEGGNGDDYLIGGDGNDYLDGGTYEDFIEGGPGNDELHGDDQPDVLVGGEDDDRLFGENGDDQLFGDAGNDVLHGGVNDDSLAGGEGDDVLYGEQQADVLDGGDGSDLLYGGPGNDVLLGGAGDDHLLGGLNEDVLSGGPGNDILEGGLNADVFVFGPGDGQDVIVDFQNNVDTIDLTAFGFADVDEALSHFAPDGSDMVFTYGADVLRIQNAHAWELPNDLLIA